jgi:hypothetical protein
MIASPLICNPQPGDRRIGELVERRLHVNPTTPGQWINVSFMLLADAFQKV